MYGGGVWRVRVVGNSGYMIISVLMYYVLDVYTFPDAGHILSAAMTHLHSQDVSLYTTAGSTGLTATKNAVHYTISTAQIRNGNQGGSNRSTIADLYALRRMSN